MRVQADGFLLENIFRPMNGTAIALPQRTGLKARRAGLGWI